MWVRRTSLRHSRCWQIPSRASNEMNRPTKRRTRPSAASDQAPAGQIHGGVRSFRLTFLTSPSTRACSHRRPVAFSSGATCIAKASGHTNVVSTSASGSGLLTVRDLRTQWRGACSRDRHRGGRDAQYARQRVSRDGVADRVTAATVDLYPWGARGVLRPDRREPVSDAGRSVRAGYDPSSAGFLGPQPHRPPDQITPRPPWRKTASPTSCSCRSSASSGLLSYCGTGRLLCPASWTSRWSRSLGRIFAERSDQISRVDDRSDALHLRLGDRDVVVAYLLELTRRDAVKDITCS